MKNLLFLIYLLLISFSTFSQTQFQQKTWQLYQQTTQFKETNQTRKIQDCYTVELQHTLPDFGTQDIKYKLYFDFQFAENDLENPYSQTLKLVEKCYNIDDKKYTEEFLFDNGNLVYFFKKEQFGNFDEYRMYIDNNNLESLSITSFDEQTGKNISLIKQFSAKNISSQYAQIPINAIAEAQKIIQIFNSLKIY